MEKMDLVISGLFICEFTYSHMNIGLNGQISSQNVSFFLRIQYFWSKIAVVSTTNNEAHLY